MPPIRKAIASSAALAESVDRILSHLSANKIDLEANPVRVGPVLDFDSERECFKGELSEWANMFVKRQYRQPFIVPEKV